MPAISIAVSMRFRGIRIISSLDGAGRRHASSFNTRLKMIALPLVTAYRQAPRITVSRERFRACLLIRRYSRIRATSPHDGA